MAIQLGQAFIALHADGAALAGEVRAEMEAALAEARAAAGLGGGAAAGEGAAAGATSATAAADEAAASLERMGSAGVAANTEITASTAEASAALEKMGAAGAGASGEIASSTAEADAALGRVTTAAGEAAVGMKGVGAAAGEAAAETAVAADKAAVSSQRMVTSTEKAAKSAGLLGMSWKSVGEFAGGAAIYESIKAAGNYQQQLARLQTSANETAGNIKLVSDGMMSMATTVGFSATDLSRAMYIVESGGFHGAKGLDALKASAEIAKQENADLMTTVQAVTTTLHDFGYTGLSAADAASKINEAVAFGKTNLQDFSSALHSVEPNAAAAHIKLEDVLGSLSAMTNSGMSAQQAAQNLAHTLSNYEKPTQPMIMSLAQVGINANDLTRNLGTNGLAGTVQIVSQAIIDHMGPAGTVAINALNQNKNAAQDLVTMMSAMPPEVAKLSNQLLTGQTSIKDYRTDIRKMGGEAGAMGMQFLSLYQSQDGFNGILKTGGPAVQTYLGYLARGTGTVDALRTALMLTGTNTKYVNDAIAKIGATSAQADGNVSKWAITQHTFNQQFAEAKSAVENFGLQLGQGLLPVLTDVAGFVARQVVPATQQLVTWFSKLANSQGAAILLSILKGAFVGLAAVVQVASAVIGGIVNVFTKLPGPVQAALLAILALKLVFATNLFGMFSGYGAEAAKAATGVGTAAAEAGAGMARLGEAEAASAAGAAEATAANVGLKGALADLRSGATTAASSMRTGIAASFKEVSSAASAAKTASREATADRFGMASADLPKASGDLAAFGGALKSVGTQGMGGLKAAGSSLMNFLGGPWGVGLLAATAGIALFEGMIQAHDQAVQKATADMKGYYTEIASGGGQASADIAKVSAQQQQLAAATAKLNQLKAAQASVNAEAGRGAAGYAAAINFEQGKVDDLTKAQKDAWNSLSPLQQAQVTLNTAVQQYGPASSQAAAASRAYQGVLSGEKTQTDLLNAAEQTHLQQLETAGGKQMAVANASLASQQAALSFKQSLDQLNKGMADGSLKGNDLKQAQLGVQQSAIGAAQSAASLAAAQATANGVSDTTHLANLAQLHSLEALAGQMGGHVPAAISQMIAALKQSDGATAVAQEAVQAFGNQIHVLPDGKTITISSPTAAQQQQLKDLGFTVTHMPDGTFKITAATADAKAALAAIENGYYTAVVHVTTAGGIHVSGGGNASGTSLAGAMGGLVHAFAGGGFFQSMQGGIPQIVPPNTWRVIGDRITDDEAYIPINSDPRSRAIWAEAGGRMGLLGQGGDSRGAKTVHVTYSPQYHLPPAADPNQVAAMVGANTARDFQLGMESLSSLGWATN